LNLNNNATKINDSEQLSQALGVPLFVTDLYMPVYKEVNTEHWKIKHLPFGHDHGYYSGNWTVQNMPVLLRNTDLINPTWQSWMSLSAHEIESQEFGCRYAYGETVVMGLGMGWVAINAALNPAVTRVTIVEYDPEVIILIEKTNVLNTLPEGTLEKLNIVNADALKWMPQFTVDFLYADIWLKLAEPQTLDEVRRMQDNVQAETIYYWGQELTIYEEAKKSNVWKNLNKNIIRQFIDEKISLPLLIPHDINYTALIEKVIQGRKKRRL
jgi:hypothetical protein